MVKLEILLDDGSITNDILIKMSRVKSFNSSFDEVKMSNGFSYVFMSDNNDNVYQYYKSKDVCQYIFDLMVILNKKRKQKLVFEDKIVKYNIFDNLANFVSFIPDNIIVWKKHYCLNFLGEKYLPEFLLKNINKLIWDISKALYAMHSNNIYHGDCRIDNIGIYNGNFVLFDFDGSKHTGVRKNFDLAEKDIYDFIGSIKFNLGKNYKKVEHLIPSPDMSIYYVMLDLIKKQKKNIYKSIAYLEALCIEK